MPSHLDHGGENVFHGEVEVAAIVVELSNPNTALKERNLFRYARDFRSIPIRCVTIISS